MGDLSAHFSASEFRCHGFGHAGHPDHPTTVLPALVERLERLRALCGGRPLTIVSGHRCAWWNHRVGGAPLSQHVAGAAADLPRRYARFADAHTAGFTGIGLADGWAIHVDVRPHPALWHY
jgi:zinc D-Ala-D-Ala carboxypeptidase